MPKELVLEKWEREKVVLGAYLNRKETADVLDVLRGVKGLTFDFHKTLRLNEEQKKEFYLHVQNFCKNYASKKLINVPFGSIQRLFDRELSKIVKYPISLVYDFGEMSSEELVDTAFESGCVRIENSPAIMSFDGLPILSNGYECKMVKNKYQSQLCKILKGKLSEPRFLNYDHSDF